MDDMKEALDKAAASSDQAVRGMALRYRELQSEFSQYDAFFAVYKLGIKPNGGAVTARPVNGRERTTAPRAAAVVRSDRADTFSAALKAILLAAGRPMKLNEMHVTYQAQYADDQTSIETFRQRLVKRRAVVTLLRGQGYWWADEPLPETPESV